MTKVTQSQQNNGVQTYTNTGNGGGTGYYINLGGIKMCWGLTAAFSIAGALASTSLPSGFFNSIQFAHTDLFNSSGVSAKYTNGWTTSTLSTFCSGSGTTALYWFVIGT